VTRHFSSADELADAIIERVGRRVVLGLPVGLGKALHVANALYRRALRDPELRLTIFTGLTLTVPRPRNRLEGRMLLPLVERWYRGWPEVEYAAAQSAGRLPPNVAVREFYLRPGDYLGVPSAQQGYTSVNYSQVARELLALGVNVIAQLVAADPGRPEHLSLGCNPEVTLDLLPELRRRGEASAFVFVGQTNTALPYMPGDAELPRAEFDFVLEGDAVDHPLFPLPNRRVNAPDYAAGMHVASLVPDGGTLQLGIGSLSDAVAHCLKLRHEDPGLFAAVLARLPGGTSSPRRAQLPVALGPFRKGLYACTELLSDGLFALFDAGVLARAADAADDARVHAGFFIGSDRLYTGLRGLSTERRRHIAMTRISFVNTLFGDEARKRRQRVDARFVNETMMATALGAAVSDALGDGRVVSGIGGQFDFVAMAGELDDAHSILMLRARRWHGGGAQSNIRWSYPHVSVPRQHRDVFVTEYGIAATRGRPDAEVIDAMLGIADAEFQAGLLAEARRARKVPANYTPAPEFLGNQPAAIEEVFATGSFAAAFPPYPLGTDLSTDEQVLAEALAWLGRRTSTAGGRIETVVRSLFAGTGHAYAGALARMGLGRVRGWGDWLDRRLVIQALKASGRRSSGA
jgi:acyl-CoA hydrolase